GAALLGVRRAGGDLADIAGAEQLRLAVAGDRHLAVEQQHLGVELVAVLGVETVWLHVALDRLVAAGLQFALECGPVHRSPFSRTAPETPGRHRNPTAAPAPRASRLIPGGARRPGAPGRP